MKIAICDDDKIFLEKFKTRLSEFDCDIYSFSSVPALINSNVPFDAAFLDIEFDSEAAGFGAVRHLRMRNEKCIVSFLTNYSDYAVKGYDYNAFRYILKNEPERIIERRIKDVFSEHKRRHTTISGSYNGYTFSAELDDIYYLSISNHVITIHSKKGDFELYKQMKDIDKRLYDLGFLRCHRSYIVNLKYVTVKRSDDCFVLGDPERTCIPIGIRYKEAAEKTYLNFVAVGG